nr:TorF family putative porin [uncultured Roseateles sp.]
MKHTLVALLGALTVSAMPTMVHAEEPASPLTFNVSVTTDYRYRGISQSRLKPALQGGADYDFGNGFYVGTWASTIKWIKDGGGDGNLEIDLYGGYKTELSKGLTLDVGVLQYVYPSNKLNPSANTTELYGALTFGVVTAKYSHSVSNLFGFPDSKQSGYLDLSAALDLGEGFSLTPHVGHQSVKHLSSASYTDYSLTLNKDYAGFTFGLAAVGTSTDSYLGAGKNLGKNGLVLSVKKAF